MHTKFSLLYFNWLDLASEQLSDIDKSGGCMAQCIVCTAHLREY